MPRLGLGPKLIGNLKAKIASEIAIKLIRVVTIALAARWLGSKAFGSYAYALAIGYILVQFADFGLQLHLAREIARSPKDAGPVFASVARAKILLSGCVVGAFIVIGLLQKSSAQDRLLLWILGGGLLLASFVEMANYVFRGFQKLDFEARLNVLHIGSASALGLAAIRAGWGARGLAGGALVAAVASAVIAAHWVHRHFIPWQQWILPRGRTGIMNALRPSAPIGVAILLAMLYFRVDVLFLERYQGKETVGLYAAAHKLLEAPMTLPAVFLSAIYPAFSELTQVSRESLRRLCRTSIIWLLLLSAPLACGLLWLAGPAVRLLYGAEYLRAVPTVQILSPALIFIFLNYALTHFLIGLGRQRYNAVLAGICLVVNIVGNALLVPRYGMAGAAGTRVLTEVTLFALAYPLVRHSLRRDLS